MWPRAKKPELITDEAFLAILEVVASSRARHLREIGWTGAYPDQVYRSVLAASGARTEDAAIDAIEYAVSAWERDEHVWHRHFCEAA